jgi:hypothetical protein
MKAIKNFDSFKKSLLSATNGNMVESFDSSNMFGGSDYQSYRVYVDATHYYNMFVIYNFQTNTYDVSLETSTCAVSTMARVAKTQKAMIESVCRWCYYSYLNTKEISIDSEEYTDRCEESEKHYDDYIAEDFIKAGIAKECTDCSDFCEEDCIENAECARGNDVFDGCKQKLPKTETNKIKGHIYIDTDSVKVAPLPEQQTVEESIKDTIIADDNNAYQTAKVTKTKHSVLDVMQCMMCPADREGNRCGGKQWCKQTLKRYTAIVNPEWHNVSLSTLANIDFDMLDEKRKIYLSFYKKWQEVRKNLRKCSCGNSYERCRRVFRSSLTIALDKKEISKALVDYFDRQISMVNVECGVWSSMVEVAMGQHDSRKYNRATLRY